MTFYDSTKQLAIQNNSGEWKKIFSTNTTGRLGIYLYVHSNSDNDIFIRILDAGSDAPSTITENDANFKLYKEDFVEISAGGADDDKDVWFTGADGSGGVATINAWELV